MVTFFGEEFSELKTPYDTYIPTNEMGNNIIKTVTENVQLKIIGTGYKKYCKYSENEIDRCREVC